MNIAVFDLDGTLLDTLSDLHTAVCSALERHGYPPRSCDEVRSFVGDGVEQLIRRALPTGADETAVADTLEDFKILYAAGCETKTAPYDGILPLLDALRQSGVRTAVVSNKFDAATKQLCARYFGERIEVAIGEREADGIRKKPCPDTVFEALNALGVSRKEMQAHRIVYIGDSDVDIETAQNAGIPCISVTWGFRDADFLVAHGATTLVRNAEALKAAIVQ